MIKIGIIGAPSSGKTTLARRLSSSFVGEVDNVELVAEYARRYILKYGRIESYWEQLKILNKQLNWENTYSSKTNILVTDCPIQLIWAYCLDLRDKFDFSKKENYILSDIFSIINKNNIPFRYDLLIRTNNNYNIIDDGIRHLTSVEPKWIYKINKYIDSSVLNFPSKKYMHINSSDLDQMILDIKDQIEI